MTSLKDAVLKAIIEYNKYRSPEAIAKLIKISKNELILEFKGSFCRTCGVYDYFEDFIYELKRLTNVDIEILSFEEYETETIRVKYALNKV